MSTARETAIEAAYDALALLEGAEAQAMALDLPVMLARTLRMVSAKVAIALDELEKTTEGLEGKEPMSVDRITSLLTKGAVDGGYDVLGLSKDAPPPKEA